MPTYDRGPETYFGGTIPQWLSVLAAIIAFGWAVFLYRRSVADKRKEQPRLVYAIPTGPARIFQPGESFGGRDADIHDESHDFIEQLPNRKWVASVPVGRMPVKVVNGSNEIISAVHASLCRNEGTTLPYSFRVVAPFLAPGAEFDTALYFVDSENLGYDPYPATFFRDGSGEFWYHRAGDQIRGSIPMEAVEGLRRNGKLPSPMG